MDNFFNNGPLWYLQFFLKKEGYIKGTIYIQQTTPAQSCFKYIIWFCNLSILIVPYEGYFDRTL